MAEFQRRREKFFPEKTTQVELTALTAPGFQRRRNRKFSEKSIETELTALTAPPQEVIPVPSKSTFQPNALTDHLLTRLRNGSAWLTAAHQAWLDRTPAAPSDEKFSVALAAWTEMERSLRLVFGYEGCVFGPDRSCSQDAPVRCDACALDR
jgi:hypothetical protein